MSKRSFKAVTCSILLLFLILNVSLTSFAAGSGTSSLSSSVQKPGDLNRDGNVDLSDVVLLLQHYLFPDLYPLPGSENADDRYIYKHVVILGVDGGGAAFKQADTPNLDRIFENGSVTYTAQCMTPSISGQCWGSMLHGVLPEYHGCNNSMSTPYPSDSNFPSIFRVVRESDPGCSLASFNNWTVINNGILEGDLGIYMDSGNDDAVAGKIVNYLEKNEPYAYLETDFIKIAEFDPDEYYRCDEHLMRTNYPESWEKYIKGEFPLAQPSEEALEKYGENGSKKEESKSDSNEEKKDD